MKTEGAFGMIYLETEGGQWLLAATRRWQRGALLAEHGPRPLGSTSFTEQCSFCCDLVFSCAPPLP